MHRRFGQVTTENLFTGGRWTKICIWRTPYSEKLRFELGHERTQKNQRRGTSGSSATTFIYLSKTLQKKNNQKGGFIHKGGLGGCSILTNIVTMGTHPYVISFSLDIYYYTSPAKKCTLTKRIKFCRFSKYYETKRTTENRPFDLLYKKIPQNQCFIDSAVKS